MRLLLEIVSLTYILILAYLVLSHGKASQGLLGTTFRGYTGAVRALQGR